ncbi:MAG: Rieske 2Fe-2S domain-containing protein [Deltaproteobacteria bacterium]|nr:Rieske 2Fe-2S domain-containing protein [Deltaproteobacteria bacterium]
MKEIREGQVIGTADELAHGTTKKFNLTCGGKSVECLLACYQGKLFAYANRCRHFPLSMDWVDNHFFSNDKRYLICANHGAIYEPTSGECVWGPCYGEFLMNIPIEISDGKVRAYCPVDWNP